MIRDGYLPALRFEWLTAFYDPVVRLTTRERKFKNALVSQADLRFDEAILDLGCGSGTLAILLAARTDKYNVTGLDGDSKILGIARRKAKKTGRNISFVRGMSFELPYGDESFDHVFSSLFFHHLSTDNKLRTLKEAWRVLKSTGVFHIADWGQPDSLATKLGSSIVLALDGTDTTRDNFEGRLAGLIVGAGFDEVTETKVVNTPIGTIRLLRSLKSALPRG